MPQDLQALAAEFNRYFTSSNRVDVGARINVPRDEWRELYAAIIANCGPSVPPAPCGFEQWAATAAPFMLDPEAMETDGAGLAKACAKLAYQAGGSEPRQVIFEAYQVVGSLLSDLGAFSTPEAQKILDNLSQARMVHLDVLPWPSFKQKRPEGEGIAMASVGAGQSAVHLMREHPWSVHDGGAYLQHADIQTHGAVLLLSGDFASQPAKLAFAEAARDALNAAEHLPRKPYPKNASEIRAFLGSDLERLQYGREDQTPDDDDRYTLTAHDLLSAFFWWEESWPLVSPALEREVFEAWATREGYPTNLTPGASEDDLLAGYDDPRTHAAWRSWKGRAWAEPQQCGDEGLIALAAIRDNLTRRFRSLPSEDEAVGRPQAVPLLLTEALRVLETVGASVPKPDIRAHVAAIHYRLKFGPPLDERAVSVLIAECESAVPELAAIQVGNDGMQA